MCIISVTVFAFFVFAVVLVGGVGCWCWLLVLVAGVRAGVVAGGSFGVADVLIDGMCFCRDHLFSC